MNIAKIVTKKCMSLLLVVVFVTASQNDANADNLFGLGTSANKKKTTQIFVGTKSIRIPYPDSSFVPSARKLSPVVDVLRQYCPGMNLHEFYADSKATLYSGLSRHCHMATNKGLAFSNISERDFGELKRISKADFEKVLDQTADEISKQLGFSVTKDKSKAAGVCIDTKDIFAVRTYMQVNTGLKKTTRACVIGFCRVKGKLVWTYTYADYHSDVDSKWAEETAINWMKDIVKENS